MSGKVKLENIAVVLHQPKHSENIGSAARAMMNMGIRQLIVVEPEDFDPETAAKLATHTAKPVLDQMQLCHCLSDALSKFHYVVGTTARLGGQRVVESPRRVAEKLVTISHENRIALLFGREDKGLSNREIRLCDTLVNIPTAEFSSLNLAQAVMVICHEIFSAGEDSSTQYLPRLAGRNELEMLYGELQQMLAEISYINPENPDYWMNHLRLFLSRIHLQAKEVSIVRGVIRQFFRYQKKIVKESEPR